MSAAVEFPIRASLFQRECSQCHYPIEALDEAKDTCSHCGRNLDVYPPVEKE